MGFILALQEALTFEEEDNKTIHYFSDSETLFKCEGGFYSANLENKLRICLVVILIFTFRQKIFKFV
jgi:hypothetical protein